MFESLGKQSDDVVWVLAYLNSDCKFSESVAQLRQAMTNSLLGLAVEEATFLVGAENTPLEAPLAATSEPPEPIMSPEVRQAQQDKKNKERFIKGVKQAVDKACLLLSQTHWDRQVRLRMGQVSEDGEPFLVRDNEPSQIIQMKQWVNALYHLEQGLRVIESDKLTKHLKHYTEARYQIIRVAYVLWDRKELTELYETIITSIHRSFHLMTHTELDLYSIFDEELKFVSEIFDYWPATSESMSEATDVLNLSEKIGFFLGLLLDQLRPDELGGMNYSLVMGAAAMLPELKCYFDGTPLVQQKVDIAAFMKRFLGDFGVDDRGLSETFIQFSYSAVESNLPQNEPLGELPTTDDGPVRRLLKALFSEHQKQEKNLDDLQDTALKLQHALSDLRHGGILTVINYIHIARHGWDLACAIQNEATALKKEVQALITEGVTYIRDHKLSKMIALVDKIEEVFLFEAGFLAKPCMKWLNSTYRFLVFHLPVDDLGSISSSNFLLERLRWAEGRHKKHVRQQQLVTHVLQPAFRRLTAFSRFISAGVVGVAGVAHTGSLATEWPKLYRPLQKYLESYDPEASNDLLRHCRLGDWKFARFKDFFTQFEVRLLSLEQTHQLSMMLNVSVIQSILLTFNKQQMLRELQRLDAEALLFIPERFEPDMLHHTFAEYVEAAPAQDNFTLANQRRLDRYLITDISDKAPVRRVAAFLKRRREAIEASLDPDASMVSSLNLLHITKMLNFLEQSCAALELLCDKHWQVTFVTQTIILFKAWVFASAVLPPYYLEAKTTLLNEYQGMRDWFKKQAGYYDVMYHEPKAIMPVPDADGMFYFMNALDIFPMHMKALHAKQDDLSKKAVLATHKKAFEASTQFLNINNASSSLMRLVFEYKTIWNLFSHTKSMGKAFLDKTYNILTQDGLNDLNEHFFFNLLHVIDLYEIKLGLKPGIFSEKFEHKIGKFFRGLLDPLGLPSNDYIALISNRAPYDRRFRDLPATAVTHQAYFRRKHSKIFFEQLEEEGRKYCIDRAMEHERKRLNDTRTGLQHAMNEMYLNAFEAFARPYIDANVKGNADIEEQVCENLQIKLREFQALHDRDYRRLDTICDVLAELKKYLAVPAHASLFETTQTQRRKIIKVEQLEKIAQDIKLVPAERINKMRRVMQKENFQATMLAYAKPDWFTYDAFKRAVLWLLECVGLYTPDCRTNYNNLVRSVDPNTHYTTSPLIKLGLFDTPVSSYERKEDKLVYKQLGITWCNDLEESLASSHEHP